METLTFNHPWPESDLDKTIQYINKKIECPFPTSSVNINQPETRLCLLRRARVIARLK